MISGGFLPLPNGFLPSAARNGFVPPSTAGAAATWSTDATSGKGVPASSAEWTAVMSAAGIASGGPSALHLCQEAAGNLADPVGGLTLTAAGTAATYQQAVAGWARKAVLMADAATTVFSTTDAALPDLASASMMTIAYVSFPAANPATIRGIVQLGANGTRAAAEFAATGILSATCGANTTTAAGDIKNAVRPVVTRYNFTASEMDAMTDVAKASPAWSAGSGKRLGIGTGARAAGALGYMYLATFFGAAAQLSDAQVKTLLETLGWAIPWS